MSLVGSEIDVSPDNDKYSHRRVVSDDAFTPRGQPEDAHPPPSPLRPAEHLFLSNLDTQHISAAALAQQIHQSHRLSSGWTGTSVATDDFATAVGDGDDSFFGSVVPQPISVRHSDILSPFADDESEDESDSYESIFKKDVLSRNYSPSTLSEVVFQDAKMVAPTPTTPATASKFFPTEAPTHVDAAEKVYDTAKGVWAWGKGVMVFRPFLGLAEGVAGKLVSMVGSNLETLDGAVVDQLHGLDDKILNPAISSIVGTLLGAVGKTEDVFKPMIIAILKPLGLIKERAENPELTTVTGVTVQ